MTGRVFSKLLFSFLLVLCIGTATLDFSLRRIVKHSLYAEAEESLTGKARLLAQALERTRPAGTGRRSGISAMPAGAVAAEPLQEFVRVQSMAAQARISIIDREGAMLADSDSEGQRGYQMGWAPEIRAMCATGCCMSRCRSGARPG
jgi:two-component system phosphate regulon sensor histidine kinase PhoR